MKNFIFCLEHLVPDSLYVEKIYSFNHYEIVLNYSLIAFIAVVTFTLLLICINIIKDFFS